MTRNRRYVFGRINWCLAIERDNVVGGGLFVPLRPHFFAVAFASVTAIGSHHLVLGGNDKTKVLVVLVIVGFGDALEQQIASGGVAGFPGVAKHALPAIEKDGRRTIWLSRFNRRIISQIFVQL